MKIRHRNKRCGENNTFIVCVLFLPRILFSSFPHKKESIKSSKFVITSYSIHYTKLYDASHLEERGDHPAGEEPVGSATALQSVSRRIQPGTATRGLGDAATGLGLSFLAADDASQARPLRLPAAFRGSPGQPQWRYPLAPPPGAGESDLDRGISYNFV